MAYTGYSPVYNSHFIFFCFCPVFSVPVFIRLACYYDNLCGYQIDPVGDDMADYLRFFSTFFFNILDLMSSWMIVEGVSVLGVLIAVACMAIVFGAILYRV